MSTDTDSQAAIDQKPTVTTNSQGGRVMRLSLAVAGEPITVTLRELTVAEISDWMEGKISPSPALNSWDLTAETMMLTDIISLADLLSMSDLGVELANELTPSVLTDLAEKSQSLNTAFFLMIEKIALLSSMEAPAPAE